MVDSFEANTHAFIVRIWYERREITGADLEWRGVIEHVASGKRRYFQGVHGIEDFVREEAGVGGSQASRWKSWLSKIKARNQLKR